MRAVPMRMRKERASILTEGWRETKSLMNPEAAIMTTMEMITASIMRVVDHADGGDDGVEGEDEVDHGDLDEDGGERGGGIDALGFLVRFELVVDFGGGFPDEEEAAGEEDEVLPGDAEDAVMGGGGGHHVPEGGVDGDFEEGALEAHDPADGGQEEEAHEHGEAEADEAGLGALGGGEAVDEDGDEDDVVDAEDDLEEGEGEEGGPGGGIGKPVEHGGYVVDWRRPARTESEGEEESGGRSGLVLFPGGEG